VSVEYILFDLNKIADGIGGCLLTDTVEQQEVLNFIDSFGKSIGWPIHRLKNKLNATWN
jgi:hypothetical protein